MNNYEFECDVDGLGTVLINYTMFEGEVEITGVQDDEGNDITNDIYYETECLLQNKAVENYNDIKYNYYDED